MQNREIEVRFLEIDKDALIKKLQELRADDLGEEVLSERIFYDKDLRWMTKENNTTVRVRKTSKAITVAYKRSLRLAADGTEEIEFTASDADKVSDFLKAIGLIQYRLQEKRRHTFQLGKVTVDIDMWPRIPPYVELEGESEQDLKDAAVKLELDWKDVIFENARVLIEKYYGYPISQMRYFTFEKIEE